MIYGVDLSHHNDDVNPVNFDLLAGHVGTVRVEYLVFGY